MDTVYTKELLTKLSTIISDNDIESDEDGEYNDEGIKYKKVVDGDWTDEGKYSYRTDTFYFPELNVYVEVDQSRSGSYYTDYYYDEPTFGFVEPHTETKVVTVYRSVKAVSHE